MTTLELTCKYCDKKWEMHAYSYSVDKPQCPDCKDKNIIIRKKDNSKSDIFGYNRTKAFPDAYVKGEDDE